MRDGLAARHLPSSPAPRRRGSIDGRRWPRRTCRSSPGPPGTHSLEPIVFADMRLHVGRLFHFQHRRSSVLVARIMLGAGGTCRGPDFRAYHWCDRRKSPMDTQTDVAAAGGVPRRFPHPHRAGLFRLGACRADLRAGRCGDLVLRAADRGAGLVRVPGDPGRVLHLQCVRVVDPPLRHAPAGQGLHGYLQTPHAGAPSVLHRISSRPSTTRATSASCSFRPMRWWRSWCCRCRRPRCLALVGLPNAGWLLLITNVGAVPELRAVPLLLPREGRPASCGISR